MTQPINRTETIVNMVSSMTDKFSALIAENTLGPKFSWIVFRDETLIKALEFSCGPLNTSEKALYQSTFNDRMVKNGYALREVNELDNQVDDWHNGQGAGQELHEYLSLSWADYNFFVHGTSVYVKA